MTSHCEFLSVILDSVYFGDIDSAATVSSVDRFLLNINSDARPGAMCKMHIDFYDDADNHWESDFCKRIQGFFDDMEIEGRNQWTHGYVEGAVNSHDDWQYGRHYGKSGDPNAAHSPDDVWGNDLGWSG